MIDLRTTEEATERMWHALETRAMIAQCSTGPLDFVVDQFWLWVARRFVWAAERNRIRARMAHASRFAASEMNSTT